MSTSVDASSAKIPPAIKEMAADYGGLRGNGTQFDIHPSRDVVAMTAVVKMEQQASGQSREACTQCFVAQRP